MNHEASELNRNILLILLLALPARTAGATIGMGVPCHHPAPYVAVAVPVATATLVEEWRGGPPLDVMGRMSPR